MPTLKPGFQRIKTKEIRLDNVRDIVLMGDKLQNIAILIGMARHAKKVLWQNLIFASSVIILLLIAAFGINLALPMGVVGHEGSTVLVCLNGLRLLMYRPKPV